MRAVEAEIDIAGSGRNTARIIGKFFHELIRKAATCDLGGNHRENLEYVFSELVKQYKAERPDLNLGFSPLVRDIYETVCEHISPLFNGEFEVEREIESRDSALYGTPDWVATTGDAIEIIDFKLTTKIERLTTEKNLAQLDFYAFLVGDSTGTFPESGRLIGLNGVEANAKLSETRSRDLANAARGMLVRLGASINDGSCLEDLATPNRSECATCKFRVVCDKSMVE